MRYSKESVSAIYRRFLSHFIAYERITSTHQPNNSTILIAKLKAGIVLSGMILDERWSAQVQMSYHIHADRQQGFNCAFSLEFTVRE